MGRFITTGGFTLIDLESGMESVRDGRPDGYDGFSSPSAGMSWRQPRDEIVVPLRGSDGALLGYSQGMFDQFTMRDVRIMGANQSYKRAKSYRAELLASLDLARLYELTGAGTPVYWEYGIGDDDDPDIYRIITGDWSEPDGTELSIGIIHGELIITCVRE